MNDLQQVYQKDYNLWLEQVAHKIKNREIDFMDWDNLLAEIEDMGASQKRALRSYTKRLIEHILKIKYWDIERERNFSHWQAEIVNFRDEVLAILADSPSLKNYLKQNYESWYESCLASKSKEFEIPLHSKITLATLLDKNYFGEGR